MVVCLWLRRGFNSNFCSSSTAHCRWVLLPMLMLCTFALGVNKNPTVRVNTPSILLTLLPLKFLLSFTSCLPAIFDSL